MAKKPKRKCSNCIWRIPQNNNCIIIKEKLSANFPPCEFHQFEKEINIDSEIKSLITKIINDLNKLEKRITNLENVVNGNYPDTE